MLCVISCMCDIFAISQWKAKKGGLSIISYIYKYMAVKQENGVEKNTIFDIMKMYHERCK